MFFVSFPNFSHLQIIPQLKYTDISQATFRSQTTMERMGPIRPNVINKWTLFQAREHPDQYDLDDGVVVVKEEVKKPPKKKHNLRSIKGQEIHSDTIIVDMGKKEESSKKTMPKQSPDVSPTDKKPFAPRVRVDLYMESLCPDTHAFVRSALSKVAHDPLIMEITDLHMYMFGKGEQISREPAKYNCQHGPAECHGNMVENCIIKHSTSGEAVDMMMCLHEKRKFDENTIDGCAAGMENGEVIKQRVMQCIQGEGVHLLQKAYDKTPRNLAYVPSMRINKKEVKPAVNNLKDVICNSYTGEKPSSCP